MLDVSSGKYVIGVAPNKRMNRSRLAFQNFGAFDEFNPTFGPVILGVRHLS